MAGSRYTLHWDITCAAGYSTIGQAADPSAPYAGLPNAVRILHACRATMARVRFYPGPQLTVIVEPWVQHGGVRRSLVAVAGRHGTVPGMETGGVDLSGRGVRGDDDLWEYDMDVDIAAGDWVGVAWRNGDPINAHTVMVDVLLSQGGA